MAPKFQVYKDAAGKFRFRLLDANSKIVAVGEAYEQHASCINGIKSIQKNCAAEVEDSTVEGSPTTPNPKYQIFRDSADKYRFHLKASNGEIIAESAGYPTKEDCLNTVEVVKSSCNSEIEDLAVASKPSEEKASRSEAKSPKGTIQAPSDKSRIVFVGNKPPMDYVLALITGLSNSNTKDIVLKARGQAIATAVDAAEITRRRFLKDLKVTKIAIGTEEMPPREGENRPRMVSTIEITLARE